MDEGRAEVSGCAARLSRDLLGCPYRERSRAEGNWAAEAIVAVGIAFDRDGHVKICTVVTSEPRNPDVDKKTYASTPHLQFDYPDFKNRSTSASSSSWGEASGTGIVI